MENLIQEFIKPELLLLVPVMFLIGVALKKSKKVEDALIPFVLGLVSIGLAVLYLVGVSEVKNYQDIVTLIFTGITQGVLVAGMSVYAHQLQKQAKELKE